MDKKPIRRALISVYDKSGLIEIAGLLQKNGVKILSTGSTAKQLIEAGIKVETVESYTGSAEMLDGRVKTLHPRIHAGILADQTNNHHLEQLKAENIEPFDLVIINLYPFTQTVSSGADFDDCIEQIDIGGPSLLRGAAKNHKSVAVISDPSQYGELEEALSSGGFNQKERAKLAMSVFQKTAEYDSAIAQWLAGELDSDDWRSLFLEKLTDLRYGENPHQRASLYRDKSEGGITNALRHHGKEMSFNNYTDAEAALRAAYDHSEPCVAIIKHANPCGIAIGETIEIAYKKASIEIAYVTSSTQLTASQEEALISKLQNMSGAKQIKLKLTVDENLIGGFIVQVGSKIIDSSIKGQLRQLASYLGASVV